VTDDISSDQVTYTLIVPTDSYNTTRQTIVFFFITLYLDMCFCIGNMVELAASISGPRLIYGDLQLERINVYFNEATGI
jgi:hypothetical protein